MNDSGNILPKVGTNTSNLPISRIKSTKTKEGDEESKPLSLADLQDTIQIDGPKEKDSTTKIDVSHYVQMLKEMDDVRPDEIGRIQSILSEDGYNMDAIDKVIDNLLDDKYV
jgi:hypothetical protein